MLGLGWIAVAATPMPVDPAIAIFICRQQFVVDSYEVIGVDPSFGGA
jgi:hypothetical protein